MAIIRNLTASDIALDDLSGITVEANSDYDLKEESQNDIANSQDLNSAISSGDIVFLDAQGNALSQQESLNTQDSVSAALPAFKLQTNDSTIPEGPFSTINFRENADATGGTKADVDFLQNVDIFKTTIGGQEMLAFNDPNRSNKILSVEKVPFLFVQSTISAGTWLKISKVTLNTTEGYIMPMNGTVVGLSSHLGNSNGRTGTYDLHFDNDGGTPTLITYSGSGEKRIFDNTLDYDFSAGQTLQFRCDTMDGHDMNRNQFDINVVLYVRWRG